MAYIEALKFICFILPGEGFWETVGEAGQTLHLSVGEAGGRGGEIPMPGEEKVIVERGGNRLYGTFNCISIIHDGTTVMTKSSLNMTRSSNCVKRYYYLRGRLPMNHIQLRKAHLIQSDFRFELLSHRIYVLLLCSLPVLSNQSGPLLISWSNLTLKRIWHTYKSLCQSIRIDRHSLPISDFWSNIEPPKHPRHSQKQGSFRDMHPLTNPSSRTKREMISLWSIWISGTIRRGLIISLVSFRAEFSRVWMSSLVHVNTPDVQHDTGALRDKITHVFVIFGCGVGDSTGDCCGHPSQSFLDHCSDVRKLRFVGHGGKSVGANDPVDLILCFLLDIREASHSLNKGDQCRRCGIWPSFQ